MIGMVLLLVAVMAMNGSAQRPQAADEYDRDVAGRIAALSERLRFKEDDPESAHRYIEFEPLTERIRREVDGYIHSALNATEGSQGIQARLRTVLAAHTPNPEYGDLPFARVIDIRGGRSLIVAYTIVRGFHNDSATIRGYRWDVDRFELVGTTDSDFDGYNMFKTELPSPRRDEFWLLAWGQAHTFNGKKVRFRVYAFDGQGFRTVWSPDDLFNATPHVTESGFTIDHEVRYLPYEIHDEYTLTQSGPIKR
jgi:hypothetical protein